MNHFYFYLSRFTGKALEYEDLEEYDEEDEEEYDEEFDYDGEDEEDDEDEDEDEDDEEMSPPPKQIRGAKPNKKGSTTATAKPSATGGTVGPDGTDNPPECKSQ